MTREVWLRSITRALTWRVIASVTTAVIAVGVLVERGAVSRAAVLGGALAVFGADFLVKLALKIAHERVWADVRWGLEQRPGYIVALFGLPCSGKTTIARSLADLLDEPGRTVVRLDGDTLRGEDGLCRDLDFSQEGRAENLRRTRCLAAALADAGAGVVVANIMPYAADRQLLREVHARVLMVHVDTPADVCEARDVKGMWKKARTGELADFTGVDAPFEPAAAGVVTVRSVGATPEACAEEIHAVLCDQEWL